MHKSTMRGVLTIAVATGIVVGSTRSFLTLHAQQANRSRSFGPGVCGPADPVYFASLMKPAGNRSS